MLMCSCQLTYMTHATSIFYASCISACVFLICFAMCSSVFQRNFSLICFGYMIEDRVLRSYFKLHLEFENKLNLVNFVNTSLKFH